MLWTDQDFVTSADLLTVDPDVQLTAESLSMTLDGDNSVCRRGIESAGSYLESKLSTFSTYLQNGNLSPNHMAAVFMTGVPATQPLRYQLDQMVVDDRGPRFWSEFKQWIVNHILRQFYLAAANRSEGDRYEKKLALYMDEERLKLWPRITKKGLPLVYRPLARPAALMSDGAGSWAASLVTGAGTSTAAAKVYVTYVSSDAPRTDNSESAPSDAIELTLENGKVVSVDITNLTPPTGTLDRGALARGYLAPLRATGWNVYVGLDGTTPTLQNSSPIPIGTKTLLFTTDPTTTGAPMGTGQYVEVHATFVDGLIQRG